MTDTAEASNALNQPISLNLTVGEVNYVLNALSQRPFGEVAALIAKVKEQGDAQFSAPPAVE